MAGLLRVWGPVLAPGAATAGHARSAVGLCRPTACFDRRVGLRALPASPVAAYRGGMERDQAIADYLSGLTALDEVVAAGPAVLARVPEAGGWSAAQVVHHLADTDVVSSERLRRMLAEDRPAQVSFDPDAWTTTLDLPTRTAADSAALVRALRMANVGILTGLSDEQWQRQAQHPTRGPVTVETWLLTWTQHLHEHVSQALGLVSGGAERG